jgi:glycosyltransferase involved in cell wall biosynthesis
VAQDGLSEPLLSMQRELRRTRRLALPHVNSILPISDYIRRSQTEPDRGSAAGVRTVLLGADHMELGLFSGAIYDAGAAELLQRLDLLVSAGAYLLLCLGRFEDQGYKNSAAAYDVFRGVLQKLPAAHLLLLDAGHNCRIPADLADRVVCLGMPDDHALQQIMLRCHACLSPSLWEGFNLPVVEAQWLGRPTLAFNLGAHPEVTADPWLLCGDIAEMTSKTIAILSSQVPINLETAFSTFRDRFRWERTLVAWETEIAALASDRSEPGSKTTVWRDPRKIVVVDVTNAALDPANPGVIRVVRRLSAELQQREDLELVFAAWDGDARDYVFLDATRRTFLEGFGGPTDGLGVLAGCNPLAPQLAQFVDAIGIGRAKPPVLFLPEVILDGSCTDRVNWARTKGYHVAAILHDVIPVEHPEFCAPYIVDAFPGYLEGLVHMDALWCISQHTQDGFRRYLLRTGMVAPHALDAIWLPGQFSTAVRVPPSQEEPAGKEIRILCVSTLEPRKNHARLIEAFQLLRARRPDLPVRLVLVGNRYAAAPEIALRIEAAAKNDARIVWHGITTDELLAQEFRAAAFTVYPSLVEGFGLPVMESLWMGRPCLVHNSGVMQELAAPGGCLTVDMMDPTAIAERLEQLATDRQLRGRLREEGAGRAIATWGDYAQSIAKRLLHL